MDSDYKRLRELAIVMAGLFEGPWLSGDVQIVSDANGNAIAMVNLATNSCAAKGLTRYLAATNPQTVLALLDALERELADARRYRYMRQQKSFEWSRLTPTELDAAIDRAMGEP